MTGEAKNFGKEAGRKVIFSGNVQKPVQCLEAAAFFVARQNFSGSFSNSRKRQTTRSDASTEVDDACPTRADIRARRALLLSP